MFGRGKSNDKPKIEILVGQGADLRKRLAGGAVIVLGRNAVELATQFMARENANGEVFIVPVTSAQQLAGFPLVEMSRCLLYFFHNGPWTRMKENDPASTQELDRWRDNLLRDADFGPTRPQFQLAVTPDSSEVTAHLMWRNPVNSGIVIRSAQQLERDCVRYGGKL